MNDLKIILDDNFSFDSYTDDIILNIELANFFSANVEAGVIGSGTIPSNLGKMAYADTASGFIIPTGTVSKPTVDLTVNSQPVLTGITVGTGANAEMLIISDGQVNNVTEAELHEAPTFTGNTTKVTVFPDTDN